MWKTGLIGAAALGLGLSVAPVHAVIVDDFDNGVPTNLGGESPDLWKTGVRNGSDINTYSESGGILTMTTTNATISAAAASMAFASGSGELNFWTHPVTITVSDLLRGGAATDANQNFHLSVMAGAGSPSGFAASDLTPRLEMRLFASRDNLRFGWSASANGSGGEGNLVGSGNADWVAAIGGVPFSQDTSTTAFGKNAHDQIILTLDGTGSQLTYAISFVSPGNPLDITSDGILDSADATGSSGIAAGLAFLSGALSLADTTTLRNAWLAKNGVVNVADATGSLGLTIREAGTAGALLGASASLSQVAIVPEPASLALLAIGSLVMVASGRKRSQA